MEKDYGLAPVGKEIGKYVRSIVCWELGTQVDDIC